MANQKIEKMVVKSFEELENLAAEKGLIVVNTDNENIFNLKTSKRAKTIKMEVEVREEEIEEEVQEEEEVKEKQVHIPRDRDIKIESGKVGDIGVKLIYHRMKDGEKQFRIFLSQKIDGKLKRVRLVNDEIRSIERDEKKMIEYLHKILNKEIEIKVA